ncbi:hypothetical protein [Vibrio coralliilyticus]|uniref:hypothetical protein n=1 Tax=Vibrio coralliilyticus TaxID=190893 RepID=UPI0017E9BEB6|nr:hypothetical protein [Vibrio coralliilyticus]NUW66968.1 hypothetical protein [Vibrio coralliilyticus]
MTKYMYQGVQGLPNIAKASGISVSTLRARIKNGLSLKEAIERPQRHKNKGNNSKYEYQDVQGLPNIAATFGVSLSTLYLRMRKGLSLKEAVEKPLHPSVQYEYQGVKGLVNIAYAFHINSSTLRCRLKKGLSLEEAIEETVIEQKEGAKHKDKESHTLPQKKRGHKVTSPDLLSNTWKRALGIISKHGIRTRSLN